MGLTINYHSGVLVQHTLVHGNAAFSETLRLYVKRNMITFTWVVGFCRRSCWRSFPDAVLFRLTQKNCLFRLRKLPWFGFQRGASPQCSCRSIHLSSLKMKIQLSWLTVKNVPRGCIGILFVAWQQWAGNIICSNGRWCRWSLLLDNIGRKSEVQGV